MTEVEKIDRRQLLEIEGLEVLEVCVAKNIQFTGESTRDIGVGGISFKAIVDGQTISCKVSDEALQDHFGASAGVSCDRAFKVNQLRIENVARDLINAGQVDSRGVLIIRSGDVR